jgi:hypothetical protein
VDAATINLILPFYFIYCNLSLIDKRW